eukprot:UN26967
MDTLHHTLRKAHFHHTFGKDESKSPKSIFPLFNDIFQGANEKTLMHTENLAEEEMFSVFDLEQFQILDVSLCNTYEEFEIRRIEVSIFCLQNQNDHNPLGIIIYEIVYK